MTVEVPLDEFGEQHRGLVLADRAGERDRVEELEQVGGLDDRQRYQRAGVLLEVDAPEAAVGVDRDVLDVRGAVPVAGAVEPREVVRESAEFTLAGRLVPAFEPTVDVGPPSSSTITSLARASTLATRTPPSAMASSRVSS